MKFKLKLFEALEFICVLLLVHTLPQIRSNAEELSKDVKNFKLTVVVLTMNRPHSLGRLLNSIHNTDFEFDDDKFDVEIHVDKSMGLHYDDCVS